jgi:hypothetical protein
MRKAAAITLCALLFVAATAAPGRAWHGHGGFHHGFHDRFRSHVFIGVGPWWGPAYGWADPWWGPGYGWVGPWYTPYPYAWYGPGPYPYPSVLVDQPQMYIQQQPPASAPAKAGFWYYCASAKQYYPNVGTCPEAWIKVPPAPG